MIKPRPVFLVENGEVKTIFTQMPSWAGGFALSQKQKNIVTLHTAFNAMEEGKNKKVLEVSTKSLNEEGVALSAFNLKKYVPALGKSVPLECVFQAGKVFENGGPYLDLLEKPAWEAKKDSRLRNSGKIIAFEFDGKRYPTEPKTAFYDMLYLMALEENPDVASAILNYDAFTDIEFNAEKSVNCQAKTCALYKLKNTK